MFCKEIVVLCCMFCGCWSAAVPTDTAEGCQAKTLDLLFVLDGSGSVGGHFDNVKDFLKNLTRPFLSQNEQERIFVGVVQYSHFFVDREWEKQRYMTTEIRIGEYMFFDGFSFAVDEIVLHNYTTYTGHAMEKAAFEFASSPRFNSSYNEQVMMLVTDGKSSDSKLVPKNAQILRDMGVTTFAIGVGRADERELRLIASGNENSTDRVYSVETFPRLDSLVNILQNQISPAECSFLEKEISTEATSRSVEVTTSAEPLTATLSPLAVDPCFNGTYPIGKRFLYEDGCCRFYYQCMNGAVGQRPCTKGTVFDFTKGRCNHEKDTPSCKVPRKPCLRRPFNKELKTFVAAYSG